MEIPRYWWLLFWGVYLRLAGASLLRCPSDAAESQCQYQSSALDEYFFVINGTEVKIVYTAEYFHLPCSKYVSLDSKIVPQFEHVTTVRLVKLSDCAPPAAGYASALLAFNISVGAKLYLDRMPADTILTSQHFIDLNLTTLSITSQHALHPATQFLEPLTQLVELNLKNVKLTSSLLMVLPPTICLLTLEKSGIEELSEAILHRLTVLRQLVVKDDLLRIAQLSEAKSLRVVEITAPIDTLLIGELVENATFRGSLKGPLSGGCGNIVKLNLSNVTVSTVNAWLERCEGLQTVRADGVKGLKGAALAVRGARLRSLSVLASGLRTLPPDWLAAVPQLRVLELANNKINILPRELFVPTKNLKQLDLSYNKLNHAAAEAISVARSLETLSLSFNPLGDLCGTSGDYLPNAVSALFALRRLRSLQLVRTRATRLCADWRRDFPRLTDLALRYNNISVLEWDELQWSRDASAATTVDLRDNPLTAVRYSQDDYRAATTAPAQTAPFAPFTKILINTPLRCDCGMYWYARAAREAPAHAGAVLDAATCAGDGDSDDGGDSDELGDEPLAAVPLERLQCAVPAPPCPRGCACAVSGLGARLRCAGAGLAAVPHVPRQLRPVIEMDLAQNNITRIDAQDLDPQLVRLNLSHNRLESIDAAVLAAGRRVWLAGNPLRCDCALWPLRARAPDWPPRCACGAGAAPAPLAAAAGLVAAAALLAAALILVFVMSPAARLRIKRHLLKRGLCTRWASSALAAGPLGWPAGGAEADADAAAEAEAEAQCEYDAFISFAHADVALAEQLAARLEAGPEPRRVCLHQRDWLPGEMITAQIANSIHKSRRTVALVSEAFVRSRWARAECRTALALAMGSRRPRLVLVLLPAPEPPRLARVDPALALYAATNTYLTWADPLFWDKIERAVPPAPAPPAPPPRY